MTGLSHPWHHVSSASGRAAAGAGQRADATVRFPWQQRRGSETRNVANTPSAHCNPTHGIAKDAAFEGGAVGEREESKCLYLSTCGVPEINRNGNSSCWCSCEEKGNPVRRPRFLRVKCVCSLKGSGWLLSGHDVVEAVIVMEIHCCSYGKSSFLPVLNALV